jgi:hypothetical protein
MQRIFHRQNGPNSTNVKKKNLNPQIFMIIPGGSREYQRIFFILKNFGV